MFLDRVGHWWRQGAYLILSASLLIRAAIVLAHAHILRRIGGLAFALPRSDGLGGIVYAAASGRIAAAHDGNDTMKRCGSGVEAREVEIFVELCDVER